MADRLELRRRLKASPERVFAAWTDPALLARWMSPFAEAEASVDVRVGGTFAIVMRAAPASPRTWPASSVFWSATNRAL